MNILNKIRYRFSHDYQIKKNIKKFIAASNYNGKFKYSLKLKGGGVLLSENCVIGEGTNFPHPIGIVIGEDVHIGRNVTIYQNVTIGQKNMKYPTIEDNVIIYPNCVVFGNIRIGKGSIIGAGTIVNDDVPEDTVVVGNPMKLISKGDINVNANKRKAES